MLSAMTLSFKDWAAKRLGIVFSDTAMARPFKAVMILANFRS